MTRFKEATMLHIIAKLALCLTALVPLGGCALLGAFAAKVAPPPTVYAKYKGFADQSVAVMVWTDPGVRIDYPQLSLDSAGSIQYRLNPSGPKKRKPPKEFKGATWPYIAASVVRYQHDHPEIEHEDITAVAPRLGVSRLIYVEVDSCQTRSDLSLDLYRGRMSGTLKVVEVAEDGTAEVAYEEPDITATFPPKSPEEGVADLGDKKTYVGTVNAFADEIRDRLVTHLEEEW